MKNKFTDDTFLARWLNGQLSKEELEAFEAHEDYEAYKKIANTTADFQTPERNKAKGWEALSQKMNEVNAQKHSPKVRKLGTWWKYVIAAASVLMVVAYFALFQKNDLTSYTTTIAQQEQFTLPDGSTVSMNAASNIMFDADDFMENRVLTLEGEAFFKVIKGSSFTVQTPNGDVQVLGTQFNVQARKAKLAVTCYSGKVGVRLAQLEAMEILNPGYKVIAKNQQIIQKLKVPQLDAEPSWTNGQSKFNEVNFIEVIEELERQFDITIDYPNELAGLPKYVGGFPHNDLETALDIIFPSIGYQYKINGRQIIVFK